jgi:Flp pilus assembly pilin Flp
MRRPDADQRPKPHGRRPGDADALSDPATAAFRCRPTHTRPDLHLARRISLPGHNGPWFRGWRPMVLLGQPWGAAHRGCPIPGAVTAQKRSGNHLRRHRTVAAGQGLVEYSLLLSLIAGFIVAVLLFLGSSVSTSLAQSASSICTAATATSAGDCAGDSMPGSGSAPTEPPTATPGPTSTVTPAPTAPPTTAPAPTADPTPTPRPTWTPHPKPTPHPTPTPRPTRTPRPTPTPTPTPHPTGHPHH